MKRRLFHVVAGDIAGVVLDGFTVDVDGLTSGAVKLGSVGGPQSHDYAVFFSEGDQQFDFWPFLIRVAAKVAQSVIGVASLSIGTNAPAYNNILPATALTGLSVPAVHTILMPALGSAIVPFGSDVYVNITGVGVAAALTLTVSLLGGMVAA